MLRFAFWSLLSLNALLLAYNLGYLGDWSLEAHEPGRLKKQHHAEQLRQIPASAALAAPEPAPEPKPELIACLELGSFLQADTARVESKLKTLALAERQTRVSLTEAATHMVYIPPLGSKEAAERKAGELHRLGINDFFIVQDQTPMRWGISLGVFKTEEAAKLHLGNLNSKGVRTARIGPRNVSTTKFAYQLRNLGTAEKKQLDALDSELPAHESRSCTAEAERGAAKTNP